MWEFDVIENTVVPSPYTGRNNEPFSIRPYALVVTRTDQGVTVRLNGFVVSDEPGPSDRSFISWADTIPESWAGMPDWVEAAVRSIDGLEVRQ